MDSTYAKTPDNPIQLNSVAASRLFLDNLITTNYCHLVYHRPGSLYSPKYDHPIDHYEIMTADNRYEDFYINIYNKTNTWIPPGGYLFIEVIRLHSEGLNNDELKEINEPVLSIDDQFILFDQSDDTVDDDLADEPENDSKKPEMLDLFLHKNYGVNARVANFPTTMIVEAIEPGGDPEDLFFSILLKTIKPRKQTPE